MSSAVASPAPARLLSEQERVRAGDTSALGGTALLTGSPLRMNLVPVMEREEPAMITFAVERPPGIELPAWAEPAIQVFYELLALGPGWDSYAGVGLSTASARSALAYLADVMQDNTPLPSFVPKSNGGVQLEWHFAGGDVEVEFDPSEGASAYICDIHSAIETEGSAEQLKVRIAETLARME
jgi:hypothetical protein